MDRNQTLAQAQKIKRSPEGDTYGSGLTRRIDELVFRKKIKDFTIEDLRILIGQNESLSITIPMALEQLRQNPMAEGDYYPGDLLKATLNSSPDFWKANEDHRAELEDIFIKNKDIILNFEDLADDIKDELRRSFDSFILM